MRVAGLAFTRLCRYSVSNMKRWSARQVFALLLGVFVTLGMNLSAIQASDMMVKMTMSSDMGASGYGDCNGCDDGDKDGANAVACMPTCVAPLVAVLPQERSATVAQTSELTLSPYTVHLDRASTPDPYPPRPSDLG